MVSDEGVLIAKGAVHSTYEYDKEKRENYRRIVALCGIYAYSYLMYLGTLYYCARISRGNKSLTSS